MKTLADIKRLPRNQRNALGQICAGDDSCLHPKTLESLERKGFVRSFSQTMGGGIFSVVVRRYVAPANIIAEWMKFYERCSCGMIVEKGKVCGNPETRSCTTRVKYGKYSRKTKAWE
jgi:hypothetical protein